MAQKQFKTPRLYVPLQLAYHYPIIAKGQKVKVWVLAI